VKKAMDLEDKSDDGEFQSDDEDSVMDEL